MTIASQQINVSSAAGMAIERRSSLRYPLRAEAIFAWDDELGLHRERHGHTRDVGRKGAFIFATDCPPSGAVVALSVFLPASSAEAGALRIEAQGRVVRAETEGDGELVTGTGAATGFAVSHQSVNLFSR
jgi:hypothetical protein